MVKSDVEEEIKVRTEEELAVLLAVGPKGCSWEKLRYKIRIVELLLKSLGWEFIDLSDETVWEILSSAKNRTLWIKKRGHCITTELGTKAYYCLLEKISKKNTEFSKFIDLLHRLSVSDLQMLADWFTRAKSVEFLDLGKFADLMLAGGKEIRVSNGRDKYG
jgi:hypothetical protein